VAGTTALGIICKTPQPGASKTRLARIVGADEAALLSAAFIQDVSRTIVTLPAGIGAAGYAVYAPAGSEEALRAILPPSFGLLLQADQNFGEVLRAAAAAFLAQGHDGAILVNSDSPTLPASLLAAAITALRADGDRVVLGPAIDGGYYLIGLKRAHAALFADVPWSTPEVLPRTLERAAAIGLAVSLLPAWYDIDDAESFAILEAELAGQAPAFAEDGLVGGPAAATRTLLAQRAGRGGSQGPEAAAG